MTQCACQALDFFFPASISEQAIATSKDTNDVLDGRRILVTLGPLVQDYARLTECQVRSGQGMRVTTMTCQDGYGRLDPLSKKLHLPESKVIHGYHIIHMSWLPENIDDRFSCWMEGGRESQIKISI